MAGNRSLSLLTDGVAAELLEPPVDVQWACTPAAWLRGSSTCRSGGPICCTGSAGRGTCPGDPGLAALHRELSGYPAAVTAPCPATTSCPSSAR